MIRTAFLVSVLLQATLCFSAAGEYEGKVGKMKAVFSLHWKDDGSVSGTYAYPDRQGIAYTLSGNNPAEGKLYLEEYTRGELTARCHLKKVATDSAITWTGEMHNTDGRSFPMHFSRSRDTRSVTIIPPAPIQEGTRYTGHVGKLGAVYFLNWHKDGSVTGTYSYPDRPGTIYRLMGSNPREGELYLAEFTGDKLTARCNLSKRLTEGTIRWEGEMKNTDGRRLAMALTRSRDAAPSVPSTSNYEAKRTALLSKISTEVSWLTFPKANEAVEMVPLFLEGSDYFVGKVKEYRNTSDGIDMTFDVGEWGDGDHIIYNGPTVRFKMARSLPIPANEIVGQTIGIQIAPGGSITDIELHAIAISHIRRSNSEKLEVRGVLHTDELADLYDVDNARIRKLMARAPKLEFIPDKMALGTGQDADVFFRSIRLTPDYGIVVQLTGAGPGMLELETLSLDGPSPEDPWIFIGESNLEIQVPPSQRTGEAG